MQSFLQNTGVDRGGRFSFFVGRDRSFVLFLCSWWISPQNQTLRFSPGDGGSFLAELQQAIEDDKVTLQALWPRWAWMFPGKLLQNTSLTLMGFIQVGMEEDFANFFSEHFLWLWHIFFKSKFLGPLFVPNTCWCWMSSFYYLNCAGVYFEDFNAPYVQLRVLEGRWSHPVCSASSKHPQENLLVAFVQVE